MYTKGHTLSLPNSLPIFHRYRFSFHIESATTRAIVFTLKMERFGFTLCTAERTMSTCGSGGPVVRTRSDMPRSEVIVTFRSEAHTYELQSLMRISYAVY